jgi:thiosulfate/3-mercaptopyruvate sulfurtransferase
MSALVQAVDLLRELNGSHPPLLVDVRWSLEGPDRAGYETGHLPGAVFCDLDAELAAPPGDGGRHPLPSNERMLQTLQRLGIRDDRDVVAYDGGNALPAARAWWCLRWAGHDRVRVLDGGLLAWIAAGGELESGDVQPTPTAAAQVRPGQMPTVSADDVVRKAAGVLLDVRTAVRFRGESEPIDPVAGHIPGALSCPVGAVMSDDGRYLPPEQLRSVLAPVLPSSPGSSLSSLSPPSRTDGTPAVTAYCGSGVTAAQMVLAMHEAGVGAALYPGSWSEWIRDPTHPVVTGD